MALKKGPTLYRAHSTKYLAGPIGFISNPNSQRNRKPRDLPIPVHQILVEWFVDRFGIDYRGRALFCTGDVSIASGYKTPTSTLIAIEPQPNYSACFSTKSKDLFGYYQFYWSAETTSREKIWADMDALDFIHQHNGDLTAAANSGHEVMLVAEKFSYSVV